MRLVTYLHDEVCTRDSPVMVPGCKLSSRLFTLLLPTVKEKNRNGFFSVTFTLFQLNFTLGGSNCTSDRVVHLVFFLLKFGLHSFVLIYFLHLLIGYHKIPKVASLRLASVYSCQPVSVLFYSTMLASMNECELLP